jgi:hypothetical protein
MGGATVKNGRYLIIRTERWQWQKDRDIVARVVERDGDQYKYCGGAAQGLEVLARVEDTAAVVPPGRVQYGLQFAVGLEDARDMVKELGRIDRWLRRTAERRGPIRDFADHVQRLGEAVKAHGLIVGNQDGFRCWGFYDAQCVIDQKVSTEEVDHVKR